MNLIDFQRQKTNSDMESDHIFLKDCNNKELELFWFSHEVILLAKNCNSFRFSKNDNKEIYKFLTQLAKQIEEANKKVNGNFVENKKFTWHHMSRAWNRPLDEEAGFVATLNENCVEINFFPAINKLKPKESSNNFFISMGGPDGYYEPYQSISNLFALVLNKLLEAIPCMDKITRKDDNSFTL